MINSHIAKLAAFATAFDRYVDVLDDVRAQETVEGCTKEEAAEAQAKMLAMMHAALDQFAIEQAGSSDPVVIGHWRYCFFNMLQDEARLWLEDRQMAGAEANIQTWIKKKRGGENA